MMFSVPFNSVRFKLLDGKITAARSQLTGCCEPISPHWFILIVFVLVNSSKKSKWRSNSRRHLSLKPDSLEDRRRWYNPPISPQFWWEWTSGSLNIVVLSLISSPSLIVLNLVDGGLYHTRNAKPYAIRLSVWYTHRQGQTGRYHTIWEVEIHFSSGWTCFEI